MTDRQTRISWRHPCRPAGWLWALIALAGLLAGLWPDSLFASSADFRPATLPALRTLAVALGAYFLLAYPLIVQRRYERNAPRAGLLGYLVESLVFLWIAIPFLTVAAWVSDANLLDVGRVVLAVAALLPVGASLGVILSKPLATAWGLLAMLLLAIGGPIAGYLAADFLPVEAMAWRETIWTLSPLTWLWEQGTPGESLWPEPLWAWAIWPGAAGLVSLVLLGLAPRRDTAHAGAENTGDGSCPAHAERISAQSENP